MYLWISPLLALRDVRSASRVALTGSSAAVDCLVEYIEVAYRAAGSPPHGDSVPAPVETDEGQLHQCEGALQEAFHVMVDERRDSTARIGQMVPVELVRVTRKKPGPILNGSELTSVRL
ncbi:hypothetical protein M422DRAFT_261400 [Sphaerobolus stellatus SS14]|uniref:Unplaced genomic scaffold SPHSTscaffold_105, whole genome shotgun sequence n=1 Tax=Sphaerobolus stellatus (strain SS14) TaxID=990650 RepID=A0A0C9U0G4_SPHS4|nr:hypothetical protein M422DRAFT_261400 [Sphaerobolus stellatus SS14]